MKSILEGHSILDVEKHWPRGNWRSLQKVPWLYTFSESSDLSPEYYCSVSASA